MYNHKCEYEILSGGGQGENTGQKGKSERVDTIRLVVSIADNSCQRMCRAHNYK